MAPEDIQLFYEVTRVSDRARPGPGAGHPLDELSDGDSDWEDAETSDLEGSEEEEIMEDIQANVRHDAIKPPKARSPFSDSKEESIFIETLQEVLRNHDAPHGFGLYDSECDGGYPDSEVIPIGRRGSQKIIVKLPVNIWQPRSVVWVQALQIMNLMITDPINLDSSESDSSDLDSE
jgi:hypothetical protein